MQFKSRNRWSLCCRKIEKKDRRYLVSITSASRGSVRQEHRAFRDMDSLIDALFICGLTPAAIEDIDKGFLYGNVVFTIYDIEIRPEFFELFPPDQIAA